MTHLGLLALLDPRMDKMEYPRILHDLIVALLQLIPGPLLLVRHVVVPVVTGGVLSRLEALVSGHILRIDMIRTCFFGLRKKKVRRTS